MAPVSGFVQRTGGEFRLDGRPFRIAGTNTYYLAYVEEATLNAALDLAVSFGMNVIRAWAFLDSAQPPGASEVCFQYWDPDSNTPQVYEGENGLVRLDRAIANAGERGLRLILPLTNNWKDFGGMPQYVHWFGMEGKKNHFYTDDRCRAAYQTYARQIVTRRNTVTGRLYSEEPAILAWELANEPRCEDFLFGSSRLVDWARDMSTFIRTLDGNHLLAVGDEGYFGSYGVNCEKLLELEEIDFGTYHMYADSMAAGEDPVEWGSEWIRKHQDAAEKANKPMLLEEYGLKNKIARNAAFETWLQMEGSGALVWMTGLPKSGSQPYDADDYVIFSASEAPAIQQYARRQLGFENAAS